jgi:glycosyltransferase involved in cell wall biosynthesis
VHFLDGVGLARTEIRRYGAISAAVAERPGYFPPGAEVFVAHPPSGLEGLRGGRGRYLFTVSRLDAPKRIELLIEAMAAVSARVELRIAGTGPEEARLRELAAPDPRITFCGRVGSAELAELYAGARAVAFIPYLEDFGLVTLEAMLAGKPVITCTDSGGTAELVSDGVNGLVAEPNAAALAAAIDRLWSSRREARRMGEAARERAAAVTWDGVVQQLTAAA